MKSTLHWVSAPHAVDAHVRLYDRLFAAEFPDREENFLNALNPNSLEILQGCKLEPALGTQQPGDRVQFERQGYFSVDPKLSKPDTLVFNRIVGLKDTWAKIEKRGAR
jgi:glutaminyl-tRNA synthetase